MFKVKLFIIFLILFCSFSVILTPSEETIINPNNKTSNNYTEDDYNQEFPKFDSNPTLNIFDYLCPLGTLILGFFLGIIATRNNIKFKTSYEIRTKAIDHFNIIISQIKTNIDRPRNIISNHSIETDMLIKQISDRVNCYKVRKINKAYKKYQAPNGDSISTIMRLGIYHLEGEKFKNLLKNPIKGIDNGKDLAIHYIQNVINSLK